MEASSGTQRRPRVVLLPYPFQGHITPMLQLGSVLHSKGFSIAVAHTKFNSPNPSNHPRFTFLPLPDNLDGYDTSFYNILNAISVMNANCEAPFEEHMMRMLEEQEEQGQVACIIYDSVMNFADAVASKLKIPTMVLRTTSAAYMHSHIVMFQLLAQKSIPVPESQLDVAVPEAHPLRFKDLPLPATQEVPETAFDFPRSYSDIKSSSAVIWNSTLALECRPLQQQHQHWPVPFFPIGPLHKLALPSGTSLLEEDHDCLSWLDKQSPNSVVYISLGSLAIIGEEELIEMAGGLAKSGQPFLWAVRPSLLNGSDAIKSLPEDFKETTRERRCIVEWAPQRKVLAHPAVGGFITHCGWNSTLESICEGVPLICRPCFADQKLNARYLTHVWKVGLELESVTESGVEAAVRTLMGREEGEVMRQRVMNLKQELENSINGGDSYESLNRLVEFITSLTGG